MEEVKHGIILVQMLFGDGFIIILCIKLVNYWHKYTEIHGQQNVKNLNNKINL